MNKVKVVVLMSLVAGVGQSQAADSAKVNGLRGWVNQKVGQVEGRLGYGPVAVANQVADKVGIEALHGATPADVPDVSAESTTVEAARAARDAEERVIFAADVAAELLSFSTTEAFARKRAR